MTASIVAKMGIGGKIILAKEVGKRREILCCRMPFCCVIKAVMLY